MVIRLALLISLFASACLWGADVAEFEDFSRPNLPGRLFIPPEADDSARPLVFVLARCRRNGR